VEGLVTAVRHCGWTPIVRTIPQYQKETKGNMDNWIAPDLVAFATIGHAKIGKRVDVITLVCGDGGFTWALENYVKPQGVRIQVLGSRKPGINGRMSPRLLEIADDFVDFESILPEIELKN
jgi:uncharacterized LabA/DUF88 family protein